MARSNPFRPFVPDASLMALKPDVSGNDVNGLGEDIRRAPRMVYWAKDPADIPHGRMQQWFYGNDPQNPHIGKARRQREQILSIGLSDISGEAAEHSARDWTHSLHQFVENGTCELTGVAAMSADYLFEGATVSESRIVMLGLAHDYSQLSQAPDARAGAEVIRQYGRAGAAAITVANWLRGKGWAARPVTGPMTGDITMIPPALDCGFGELGKHGSIINPQYGASFRLAAVLTDAPFEPTPAQDHGIDDFCTRCRVCEDACPPEALSPDKQTVRGVEKWYVDFDRCLPFFNENHGCAICIAVCPWSRPGVGPNLAAKLARRAARTD